MELRVLKNFLVIAQEGNITTAASQLHLSQPTLSKQIGNLEKELGETLLERHSHSVSLTHAGALLYERAKSIVELSDQAEQEIRGLRNDIQGDVYIGAAETREMRYVNQALKKLIDEYPLVKIHLFSGNAADLCAHIDNGTLDIALFSTPFNLDRYDYLMLPEKNYWALYTRFDNPLSEKEVIAPQDLVGEPLIVSRQATRRVRSNEFLAWFGEGLKEMNFIADFNLPFNAALMAEEGIGSLITWNDIVEVGETSPLVMRPLEPRIESELAIAWRKNATLSYAAEKLVGLLHDVLAERSSS